ncbi:MAG: hypothetical protein IIU02_08270 [Treponema sp.]|uniref:hypothetical protein n=1 Tax=Treponema sp. TaxID=166 RepID=UPI0025811631|nr:hypothetical protein [Treponema sp.]MBQ5537886.1 hypothetical protein [Treponema sp.]
MVISIGTYVTLRTEKIVALVGFGRASVEIVMNPVSICFDFGDESEQQNFLELLKVAMTAEGEQAKIIADGLKNIPFTNFSSYSNRSSDSRLRDIATDIATSN